MYKLENGNLVEAPKAVHHNIGDKEYITTNARDEFLAELGYKDLVEQEKPTITEYQLISEVLEENNNTITRRYVITDKPVINDPLPEAEDGYVLEDYEYITPTEIHRGKRLVSLEPALDEAVASFPQEDNEDGSGEHNGSTTSGTGNAD